ncbi:bifunctional lytic transglycosylase/C40 family peptidase [Nocardiopsis sp. CC223A]|uniref:C40 family peptidase n=1 Tax=Nocardiopsis sp. CC223A TaxID=3044051 RepID=UPI00278BBC99|nr:bifunctional lytic transglycosylase/C40 family peptidase [Nocardiopsis sp. CC223A]
MIRLVAGALGGFFLFPAVFISAVVGSGQSSRVPLEVDGIPPIVLTAYVRAAARLEEEYSGCRGMSWPILAGIGEVESGHVADRQISPDGEVSPPFTGPLLDGSGVGGNTTRHADSDGGRWDGETEFERAVGPMQFLPATWASHGLDASGDGVADPHNVLDAAWSAAVYLCVSNPEAGGVDFTDADDLEAALLRYNRSDSYVRDVQGHIERFTALAASVPTGVPVGAAGGSGEAGSVAAAWALQQVGKPYLWGGTGPGAFDCSGLVMRAWEAAGVALPRVTTDQVNTGTRVGLGDLRPGDLLFYDTGAPGGSPSHVTMYVGGGQMVNSPRSGQVIRVEPVDGPYYSSVFVAAVRPG